MSGSCRCFNTHTPFDQHVRYLMGRGVADLGACVCVCLGGVLNCPVPFYNEANSGVVTLCPPSFVCVVLAGGGLCHTNVEQGRVRSNCPAPVFLVTPSEVQDAGVVRVWGCRLKKRGWGLSYGSICFCSDSFFKKKGGGHKHLMSGGAVCY